MTDAMTKPRLSEREPDLAVAEVEQVIGLVHGVVERAVAFH